MKDMVFRDTDITDIDFRKMPLNEAVERTVQECIEEGGLKEFLMKNRKEAVEMCIFEYDEERVRQAMREDEFDLGKKEGMEQGERQGEDRLSRLINCLLSEGRMSDIRLATNDREARRKLYERYGI